MVVVGGRLGDGGRFGDSFGFDLGDVGGRRCALPVGSFIGGACFLITCPPPARHVLRASQGAHTPPSTSSSDLCEASEPTDRRKARIVPLLSVSPHYLAPHAKQTSLHTLLRALHRSPPRPISYI